MLSIAMALIISIVNQEKIKQNMINKVILVGNVGLDPEVRTLENGVKVARVRLATTERIFNRQTNETTEHTEWHTITLWRGLAEVVDKYVHKGSQIYIEGRLRSREWERDGQKHYATEVVADEMKLLGRRGDSAPQHEASYNTAAAAPTTSNYGAAQPKPAAAPEPITIHNDPDDLPF